MAWTADDVQQYAGRHYPAAPINEAVFDIRVQLPEAVSLDTFAPVCEAEEERYSERTQIMQVGNQFTFGPQQLVSAGVQQQLVGYASRSRDNLQGFQLRRDGFTFSRVRPYQEWTTFSTEAFRLWQRYRDVTQPQFLRRIALRFINQIDIATTRGDVLDLSKYLRTRPELSPQLPQTLDGFLFTSQLQLIDPNPRLQLIETVVNPNDETLGLILDIDVYWEEEFQVNDPEFDTVLRQRFELLRHCKNAVFETSITDEARELFS
jgi:uncharacterized protein (TIGR04255 family)